MESSESEVIELSEWSLNELLAQASATARGIVLDSNVDKKDKENQNKIIRITNGMLRILIQSAAGEEIDDVETDDDVKEEGRPVKRPVKRSTRRPTHPKTDTGHQR